MGYNEGCSPDTIREHTESVIILWVSPYQVIVRFSPVILKEKEKSLEAWAKYIRSEEDLAMLQTGDRCSTECPVVMSH